MRAGRRTGRHATARAKHDEAHDEQDPSGDDRPRKRARRFTGPYTRAVAITGLTAAIIVGVTPANGAATDIATRLAHAVRQFISPSHSSQKYSGSAAVGALFTLNSGKLGSHFCTASVVDSPHGDLVITAAHCVTSLSGVIAFVPGYKGGGAPYGIWMISKVYADSEWNGSQDQGHDVAFLRVGQPGQTTPIEDVTGAERLATGKPPRQLVEVIGYPDSSDDAMACVNWTSQPMANQMEFDCAGYTDGTSGGPFLTDVSASTGQGTVVGVIGGYQQGGYTAAVSYSPQFGQAVAALYQQAVAGG